MSGNLFWPTHNFFGPGDSNYSLAPVDRDDQISKEHDLLYESARSFEDIKKADSIALNKFASDIPHNWHSLIGYLGLGSKHILENVLNTPIYPRTFPGAKLTVSGTGRKRKAKSPPPDTSVGDGFGLTTQAGSSSGMQISEESGDSLIQHYGGNAGFNSGTFRRHRRDIEGTGGAVGGGAGEESGLPYYVEAPHTSVTELTFEHVHLINSWGNQYKIFDIGTDADRKGKLMCTSLACLPVQLTSFWLNYAEYCALPPGSSIVKVECIVTPRGLKNSFATNSSIAGTANSSQCIFGQGGIGLNQKFASRNVEVSRVPTNPMSLSGFKPPDAVKIAQRLWGDGHWSSDFNDNIPTIIGIPRAMKLYMSLLHPYTDDDLKKKSIVNPGWPELNKYIKIFNFVNHIDVPLFHYNYNVKTNVLYPKFSHIVNDDSTYHTYILGGEDISLYHAEYDGKFKISKDNELKPVQYKPNSFEDYSKVPLEQSTTISIIDHVPKNSGHIQPSLHVGILPVQSNDPDKELQDFVSVCATWEVRTKCTVKVDLHSPYTNTSSYTPDSIPLGYRYFDDSLVYKNSLLKMTPYKKKAEKVETVTVR